MALQFIVSIHGGGRRNQSPYEVSFELFPSDSVAHRTRSASAFPCVHYSSIAEECSKKVQLALNASQDLRRNIVIATVGDLGWEETTGDVLDVQQQPQRLDAVVVPTFLTSGLQASPVREVSLLEIVRSPVPWVACSGTSTSSTTINYSEMEMEPWRPADVMEYLEDKLRGRTLQTDPRLLSGTLSSSTGNEFELNDQFQRHVCEVVCSVVAALGYRVAPKPNGPTEPDRGKPDWIFKLVDTAGTMEVLAGEGKMPSVMKYASRILRDREYLWKCARQEGFYMWARNLSYGFLTHHHGTFFFARTAEHMYAITDAVLWSQEGPGVIAHLTYILLKQLELEATGKADEGIWARASSSQQLQRGDVTVGSRGLSAAPAAANLRQPDQQSNLQQAVDGALANSNCMLLPGGAFPCIEDNALQLTDRMAGHGQTGPVKVAWHRNVLCAVKFADAQKQQQETMDMKREVAWYLDERLADLQGEILPVLVGCGYWRMGNIFIVATSYLDGCQKPGPSTRAALPAAKKALQRLHQKGILHGDLHHNNVLLRLLSDGNWQAYLLDLGCCREAENDLEYQCEMEDLQLLFRISDPDSALTGFENS